MLDCCGRRSRSLFDFDMERCATVAKDQVRTPGLRLDIEANRVQSSDQIFKFLFVVLCSGMHEHSITLHLWVLLSWEPQVLFEVCMTHRPRSQTIGDSSKPPLSRADTSLLPKRGTQ